MGTQQYYASNNLWQTRSGTAVQPSPVVIIPDVGTYVRPGTVGYLGDPADLTVINPNVPLPSWLASRAKWQSYGLRVSAGDLTLDHVYVTGSIYWLGGGTLTITNSVMTGGGLTSAYYNVNDVNSIQEDTIVASDTTFNWSGQYTSLTDIGAINDRAGQLLNIQRCDISGQPQGLNPNGSGSVIDSCWIHDLVYSGSIANGTNTHVDGIFSEAGSYIVITRNNIDLTNLTTSVTAALFFQNLSSNPMVGNIVAGNFLDGGSYTYWNQSCKNMVVKNNTFGGHPLYGNTAEGPVGNHIAWSGNVTLTGAVVPPP